MDLNRAYLVLGAQRGESWESIRHKYRQMIQMYHPDSAGEDPASVFLAQQINEAYNFLKNAQSSTEKASDRMGYKTHFAGGMPSEEDYFHEQSVRCASAFTWKAGKNEQAFCARNLYEGSGMYDSGQVLWHQTGHDKYYWDPDQEDFRIFIRSINEACGELIGALERQYGIYDREDLDDPTFEDEMRLKLFHLLIQEFIRPEYCLDRIAQEHEIDKTIPGKFCFEGIIGLSGAKELEHLAYIRQGDFLDLHIVNERIRVRSREGLDLGYLSFHEDSLYYVTALLLKDGGAAIEAEVKDIRENRRVRPMRGRITIKMHMRLEEKQPERACAAHNRQISELLKQYAAYLAESY